MAPPEFQCAYPRIELGEEEEDAESCTWKVKSLRAILSSWDKRCLLVCLSPHLIIIISQSRTTLHLDDKCLAHNKYSMNSC